MNVAVFSFTEIGCRENVRLSKLLTERGYACEGYTVSRHSRQFGLKEFPADLKQWIGERWGDYTFMFIGAAGIAVRYIAPWVKDKFTDSAVLVMDEKGQYVIPLLSGHIGGAVELSREIGMLAGATPVLTTGTDVQGRFAVDVFAKKNHLHICSRTAAKKVSAAVLGGETVGFYSEYPVEGELPDGLASCTSFGQLQHFEAGVAVTDGRDGPYKESDTILRLLPKNLVVGIGCRRGTGKNELQSSLGQLLGDLKVCESQISMFASIDLKEDEEGIQELAAYYHVPFQVYPAEELVKTQIDSPPSAFVLSVTGVDNVCERAARIACPDGSLLQPKIKMDKVTFAVNRKNIVVHF